jgi:hypothetical protein
LVDSPRAVLHPLWRLSRGRCGVLPVLRQADRAARGAGAAAAVIGIILYVLAQVLWMVVLPSVQVASMRFLSSDPPAAAQTPPG